MIRGSEDPTLGQPSFLSPHCWAQSCAKCPSNSRASSLAARPRAAHPCSPVLQMRKGLRGPGPSESHLSPSRAPGDPVSKARLSPASPSPRGHFASLSGSLCPHKIHVALNRHKCISLFSYWKFEKKILSPQKDDKKNTINSHVPFTYIHQLLIFVVCALSMSLYFIFGGPVRTAAAHIRTLPP